MRHDSTGLIGAAAAAAMALTVAFALSARGSTTWYVSSAGNETAGTDWTTAFKTISNAVAHATTDGDVILVTNGTYNITAAIHITNGITVRGVGGAANTIVKGNATDRGFVIRGGPGVVLEGLTIRDMLGAWDFTYGFGNHGAGVSTSTNCTIRNCALLYNQCGDKGAALQVTGGNVLMENCLVAGNVANTGIHCFDGRLTIDHCTITRNQNSTWGGGGAVNSSASLIRNSIVWDNVNELGVNNLTGTMTVSNTCTSPMPADGTGNTTNAPLFSYAGDGYGLSYSNGNFHLSPGSPCIDSGLVIASVTNDLDGNPRPVDGNGNGSAEADMGAYEAEAPTNGPLRFAFVQDKASGLTPMPVVFSVTAIYGAVTNDLSYFWDFGDGHTTNGAGLNVVTNLYSGAGSYRPRCVVNNSGSEYVTNVAVSFFISPVVAYVSTNGPGISPYDTWSKAASSIQAAIDVCYGDATTSTVIWVSNGTYRLSDHLMVNHPITLRAAGTNAVLCGDGSRWILYITGGGAGTVVDGFTITNGIADAFVVPGNNFGGGFRADANCTFRNCIFMYNHAGDRGHAAAVFGGLVVMENCLIAGHNGSAVTVEGTALGAVFRNCTITRNQSGITWGAGAVSVLNSIVYDNMNGTTTNNYTAGPITFTNCCTAPMPGSGPGNIAADPMFIATGSGYGLSLVAGNYRLLGVSPCYNAGDNSFVTLSVDLAGLARIVRNRVDMGAYEFQPKQGTVILIQ